jgi:pyruvate dehydrogenase E2 component (dihydrolipoamide acetyltransferase)
MNIIMPQLGETVAEGTVTKWHKKVGDTIKADEALFDVETDKVSTEIPSPVAGVVSQLLIAEGATAKVGVTIAVVTEAGKAPAPLPGPAATAKAESATVARAAAPARDARTRVSAAERLSPVVRRLIAERNLDVSRIKGSGRDGRVTRDDVVEYIASGGETARVQTPVVATAAAAVPASPMAAVPAADTPVSALAPIAVQAMSPPGELLPLNPVRKRVAENMAKAWAAAPHVLQVAEADFSRVVQVQKQQGEAWKAREGFALTFMPFITRAISVALGKFPKLNATYTPEGLRLNKRINIGIAVDLNFDGLMVPVVKDVPNKSLPKIAREINDLALRARVGQLRPDDLAEGTYTISNNGAFGTVITAPIINVPQVAILSTDAVRKKPVVVESAEGDTIAIRPVGVLAQSFDHRAVDGAYSAAFLREVKTIIETRQWAQDMQA